MLRDKNNFETIPFNGIHVEKQLIGGAFIDAYDIYTKGKWGGNFHRLFIGKLGEHIVCQKLRDLNIKCYRPDYYTSNENGDNGDLLVEQNGKIYRFSIKTTMANNRFLTETVNQYNKEGIYKPGDKNIIFDRHYIVRINQNISNIDLRKNREELFLYIMNLDWKYDIPGYIDHNLFLYLINTNHIIKRGEMNFTKDVYFIHMLDMFKPKF